MADENTTEILKKELEEEKEKIKRLEELLSREEGEVSKKEGLLNELYRRIMIEGMTDREEIAKAIGKEQYDALTYHLSKEHEKRLEEEKKLLSDEEKIRLEEKRLAEDEELIAKDKERINELESEITEERKKRMELERQMVKGYAPKHSPEDESSVFLEDFDLDDLDLPAAQPQIPHPTKANVTMKDLIKLLLRINRLKVIDASIMLNTGKQDVLRLARPLVSKGYVEIENPNSVEPTLRALNKLLNLKRR